MKRYAAEIGLDTTAFNRDLDSGRFAAHVREETALARRIGVKSTPTVFVEEFIIDPPTFESLQQAIELALAQRG